MGDKTTEQMWSKIVSRVIVPSGRPQGNGWITSAEFAKRHKLSRSQAYKILEDEVQSGTVERTTGRCGKCPTHFYRPVQT